jgi:hypothetical protein
MTEILYVMKSKGMRLAERVARMWVRRGAFRFLVEKAA